jgi:hypothetical protein
LAYVRALALALKTVVCSGDDGALEALRGMMRNRSLGGASSFPSRLSLAGPEAAELVDFIMSKDCLVSASLTDADKANLLAIKERATKRPGG